MEHVTKPHLSRVLRKLCLPVFVAQHTALGALAANEGWSFDRYLLSLAELELQQRETRRIQKLLVGSRLPREKTLASFDRSRLNNIVERQFIALLAGDFLGRSENVLAFGNPGSGKTHLVCALGHELVKQGHSVYFTPCVLLVQRLLRAKTELWLEKELKRLDGFAALIIDDLGYVQHSREEMEVLFTLLAHRYERHSVLLTSNLVFSEWERVFKDPMTTAAAVDRLVHHSVILEMNLPSYRIETARKHQSAGGNLADASPKPVGVDARGPCATP
jgi:DNA replication protein DnaC